MTEHRTMIALTDQLSLGLSLTEETTFDQWAQMGRHLCTAGRAINWLIGDWLIWGSDEARFGRKGLEEANAIFHSDVERFGPIMATCRRFPEERRHPSLTFGHHLVIATAVEDEGEAEALLSRAETERMTVPALRSQVRAKQAERQPQWVDDDVVDREYRSVMQAFNRTSTREARELSAESIAVSASSGYGDIEL